MEEEPVVEATAALVPEPGTGESADPFQLAQDFYQPILSGDIPESAHHPTAVLQEIRWKEVNP